MWVPEIWRSGELASDQTYEAAVLHGPGGSVIPEGLEEDLQHHDEEGGEEGVVDDIEQRDLNWNMTIKILM